MEPNKTRKDDQKPDPAVPEPLLPVEIEIYFEADGTVTFADLAADIEPIARELAPNEAEDAADDEQD